MTRWAQALEPPLGPQHPIKEHNNGDSFFNYVQSVSIFYLSGYNKMMSNNNNIGFSIHYPDLNMDLDASVPQAGNNGLGMQ